MTSFLDRVPLARINARARQQPLGLTLLRGLAGLLFLVGYLAYKVFAVLWLAIVWSAFAVAEGWREARKQRAVGRGPSRES